MVKSLRALAALAALVPLASAQAQVAYALGSGGTSLLRFELGGPPATVPTLIANLSGAVTSLTDIDFRAADGLLYGYSATTNRVVTVDLLTGVTTLVSTPTTAATGPIVGMDFNPVADRLRLVNPADQNLRVNVGTGATTVDGTLAYGAGDPNVGQNPNIQGVGYTFSDTNPLTTTQLYYLDATNNSLITTSNPNAGVLSTVGALGISLGTNLRGFDILSYGTQQAFALVAGGGGSTLLYSIDLTTGAAQLENFYLGGGFSGGFAITQVPEPGTLALAGAALGAVALRRRRRTAA